jgi:hypothetical protein
VVPALGDLKTDEGQDEVAGEEAGETLLVLEMGLAFLYLPESGYSSGEI